MDNTGSDDRIEVIQAARLTVFSATILADGP